MASENRYWLVEAREGGAPIDRIVCSSRKAAEEAEQWSRQHDEHGWRADYGIRPLTRSELAYLIAA